MSLIEYQKCFQRPLERRIICNKKYIVWQKGIGVLAKLNLWESGLENNALEYDQLEIELEMFCQDIVNEKRYHHNSFAIPKKGSGFLKFINNKIKQFTQVYNQNI